jgi:hypothetical protein
MKNGCLFALVLLVAGTSGGPAVAGEEAVSRAVYTSGVTERQPVDELTQVPAALERLYFFSEVRNLQGQTITHRWEQGGRTVLEVPFEVKAARWRVWSSKEIQPNAVGEWSVAVVDQNGRELKRSTIASGH